MARQSLQTPRHLDQFRHARLAFFKLPHFGRLRERVLQRDVQDVGHQLGEPVHLVEGHIQGAARVTDDGLGAHRTEGDDLAYVLAPVLLRDVVDHVGAAPHAEVDVDVRESDPLRVEKPFEEQVVLQGINVSDVQGVRHQAASGRPAPRPDRNAALAREPHEVPHDQEVAGKAHLLHELDFPAEALLVGLERVAQPVRRARPLQLFAAPREAFPRDLLEEAVERLSGRHLEVREDVLLLFQVYVAALGNLHGAGERLRDLAEQLEHLLGGLEEELVGRKLHPGRVVHGLPGLDAHEHVLGASVSPGEVVAIVGRDQRDSGLPRELDQVRVDPLLVGDAVVLHLQVEIALAEDVAQVVRGLPGGVEAVGGERGGNLAAQARRKSDQAVRVTGQQVFVDPRLVVEALGIGRRSELHQVPVTALVLAEDHQMVRTVGVLRAVKAVCRGEAIFSPSIAQRMIHYFAALPQTAAAMAFPDLTEREREILHLIAKGESNTAIARHLVLSTKTVQNHVSNIFSKLQVADRAQAMVRARDAGLGRERST